MYYILHEFNYKIIFYSEKVMEKIYVAPFTLYFIFGVYMNPSQESMF